jgi:plasmid stabilization system protein ParE
VKIRYTVRAASDLATILNYLDTRSPVGAKNVKIRLFALIDTLAEQPRMGRPTGKRNVRRVSANPYPYLIFYRATATEIIIDGVRHGSRRPDIR